MRLCAGAPRRRRGPPRGQAARREERHGDVRSGSTVEHKRATVRPDKGDAVAELAANFQDSSAAVLTEYRGLTVKQIRELRRALGADTTYAS